MCVPHGLVIDRADVVGLVIVAVPGALAAATVDAVLMQADVVASRVVALFVVIVLAGLVVVVVALFAVFVIIVNVAHWPITPIL